MAIINPPQSGLTLVRPPASEPDREARIGILGAAPNTGNLGVAALGTSLIAGIARRARDPRITVFDFGNGVRRASVACGDRSIACSLMGMQPTRRIYRRHSMWTIRGAARRGRAGHPVVDAIQSADAVLDVTGGDGLTDGYGPRRFAWAIESKRIVLDCGCPLVLAPQTIGPFRHSRSRRLARDVLSRAAMIWTRDRASHTALRNLLWPDFDETIHRFGVDPAFALETRRPTQPLPDEVHRLLDERVDRPLVGLNVSGLTFNRPHRAQKRFGLRVEYRSLVRGFLERLLERTDANVLLVPHVRTSRGHFEDDTDACRAVAAGLRENQRRRVVALDCDLDASETKWVIAGTDWFCATRMHAAIAALSSGVPCAAVAYSDKTHGVFDTCGHAAHVVDARVAGTEEAIGRLWRSWEARAAEADDLRTSLDEVRATAEQQMDDIVARCLDARRSGGRARLAA